MGKLLNAIRAIEAHPIIDTLGREFDYRWNRRKTTSQVIEELRGVFGDTLDYSQVNYVGQKAKIRLTCSEHNATFDSLRANLLKGFTGCPKCKSRNNIAAQRIKPIEFLSRARQLHGDKYEYPELDYESGNSKISIVCPKHGEFRQKIHKHLVGQGCPTCRESRGEKFVASILEDLGEKFERQKTFEGCRRISPLRFDFYLPDRHRLIEFDGEFHFGTNRIASEPFEVVQERDALKNEFCKVNNIPLLSGYRINALRRQISNFLEVSD